MNELKIQVEWEDSAGAKGPELRATWSSLQISVGDQVVTELYDRHSRTERSRLYMPIYPLAEWIAEHWWHLLGEARTPGRSTSSTYDKRHCLLSASEGFAMPSLLIQPHGSLTLVSWGAFRYENSPVRFLSSGKCFVNSQQVEQELRALVDSVIQRLESHKIFGTYLQEEWEAINSVDKNEEAFCRASASLGLDPFGLEEGLANEIEHAALNIPIELSSEFFTAIEPRNLREGLENFRQSIVTAPTTSVSDFLVTARKLISARHPLNSIPWEAGFEVARTLHELIPLDLDQTRHLGSLSTLFGIDLAEHQSIKLPKLSCFEGMVRIPEAHSLTLYIPRMHDHKARFALCRLVYEYLTASENTWRVVSHGRTDNQARNRAFAAEFLVPAKVLKSRLSSSVLDSDEVESLAIDFGVSSWVVRHQIENNHLAEVIE